MFRLSLVTIFYTISLHSSANIELEDITSELDLSFTHENGAFLLPNNSPSKLMPETMGSGVLVFDYDQDGDNDILFTNSSHKFNPKNNKQPKMALWQNEGNWQFSDITTKAGLDKSIYGMGAIAADYDADGDNDLLITHYGGITLFNNHNGFFRDVTERVGLSNEEQNLWSTAALFFDADGDLDLDLFVTNYVDWSPQHDIFVTYDTQNKGYTSPKLYKGQAAQLWLNKKGQFHKAINSGINISGKSLGAALWDFDSNGLLDIVVANDTSENFLFKNLGEGNFINIAVESGVAFDNNGMTRAGMGIDIADYLNNGKAAIAIGNFANEPTSLFKQKSTWTFTEDSQKTNIDNPTYPLLTFGLTFCDLDLDGWQDIITANGHVEPSINTAYQDQRYAQAVQWLRNNKDGTFVSTEGKFKALDTPMVGRGLACSDLDNDGDLDLIITSNGGKARFIKNNIDLNNSGFVRVQLRGKSPNTNAIGAKIILEGSIYDQQRLVRTGGSYLSQSEFVSTFGIEKINKIKKILVHWPNGKAEYYPIDKINTVMQIKQN